MKPDTTYVFENGKAYALREGKVIASSSDLDVLEQKVADFELGGDPGYVHHPENQQMGHPIDGPTEMPLPPGHGEPCPQCGGQLDEMGTCPDCGYGMEDMGELGYGHRGDPLSGGVPHQGPGLDQSLGHIVTPNGLKGQILGKVAGIWSDEVTVRLENGRIIRLPVTKGMKFAKVAAAKDERTPIEKLEARLASSPDGTRASLVARLDELTELGRTARRLLQAGVSDADKRSLDQIVITADLEGTEVHEAIDHLDDETTQAYQPPAPYSMGVADEAAVSMGDRDGSWLDETVNDMIADAEATDFKKLMDEGPEVFAADLPDAAIADQGVVRQMASNFIRSKTAGIDPQIRDPYEQTFLTRVEERRRAELNARKDVSRKEAAVQEDTYKDLPDDALFI